MEKLKIVAIDDQNVNLKVMKGLAAKVNLSTIDFTDPKVALEYIFSNPIDMVLVDYMMPQINGIEVIKEVRKKYPDIPIVMITAINQDSAVQLEAIQAGATEFLYKPLAPLEFQARITNLAQLRKSQLLLTDKALLLQDEVEKATATIIEREVEALTLLARTAEYRDNETGQHILRVANYSKMIAAAIGQSERYLSLILHAAPLHDIGKVAISDSILNKPGRLTDEEMQGMRKHPYLGYKMLQVGKSPYVQMGADIALYHHEKFDGSGYPKGLKGHDIALCGRIVAIADVFDALTSKRSYKEAWSTEKTFATLLAERGKHFDPVLVDTFLASEEEVLNIMKTYQG